MSDPHSIVRISVNNFDEETVESVRASVNYAVANTQPALIVDICSDGGSVYELLAMIDLVEAAKELGIVVVTYASGKAMSSGAVLLASGTPGYRYTGPNATIMVHEVSGGVDGSPDRATGGVREITRLNRRLLAMLGDYSGKGPRYFVELVKSKGGPDVYLDAKGARRHGIVDRIGTPFHLVTNDVQHTVIPR